MSVNNNPKIESRVAALEDRYTDVGLNTQTFPISDATDSDRSDIAASSKAVKKAYDDGTRYATTQEQGQVVLSHNVNGAEDNKALTPFGAKKYGGALAREIDEKLEQIVSSIDDKLAKLEQSLTQKVEAMIQSRLPLFDNQISNHVDRVPVISPGGASKWLYFAQVPVVRDVGIPSEPGTVTTTECSMGFCGPGEAIRVVSDGALANHTGTITYWRVFV